MSASVWEAYRPSREAPWNLERAWTLRRRAGFAATWAELKRDVAEGPERAVDRVLSGECRTQGVPSEFAATADLLGEAAGGSSDSRRLQAWWLYRMMFSPDPLRERLTLMWHDHFATSQLKVEDTAAMRAQNETIRRHASGPFGDLLRSMLRDPALLIWLDAPSNRKGKPNENLARELLELFTIGVGRFGESDVKETARALTGRTIVHGGFQIRPETHDAGEKTILGRTARFDGDSLAELLLARSDIAVRLAWRICDTFLGDGVADARAQTALADQLRGDGLQIGRAVDRVLRSSLFFSPANLHSRIADPVGFAVGSARALELFDPPPSTLLLAEWTGRMGQELFFPPNVGGWPGGRSWLTGRAVLARANFAAALTSGGLSAEAKPIDLSELCTKLGPGNNHCDAVARLGELLTGRPLPPGIARTLWDSSVKMKDPDATRLTRATALVLARPEAQLT
jgi:uncharacterized protein (DUF1800 family)